MLRSFSILSLLLLVAGASDAAAQSSKAGGNLNVSVKAGGKTHDANGPGSCRHTPTAAIYGVPAALWMVEYPGSDGAGVQSLRLTLWRPKNGKAEQFSLSLKTRSSSHRIDVGGRGDQVGSGKVSLSPLAAGGRFEVKGKDENGTPLELVLECSGFTGVEAEGG